MKRVLLLVILTITLFEFVLEGDRVYMAFSIATLVLSACVVSLSSHRIFGGKPKPARAHGSRYSPRKVVSGLAKSFGGFL